MADEPCSRSAAALEAVGERLAVWGRHRVPMRK